MFSDNASCAEIPDAIGWSSRYGSTVIECKTSVNDFYADKLKRVGYRHPEYGWVLWGRRLSRKQAREAGYETVDVPIMGDYRFYMSEPGIVTADMIAEHAPDHGLLYVQGKSVKSIVAAPQRKSVNKDAEIRYLRFAILNKKESFEIEIAVEAPMQAERAVSLAPGGRCAKDGRNEAEARVFLYCRNTYCAHGLCVANSSTHKIVVARAGEGREVR